MTAANVPSLRWSVGAVISTNADMQLTLLGEHGTVALRELRPKKDVDGPWQLETVNDDHHDLQPVEVLDPADRAIARFEFAVAAEDSEERAATSTWDSATRAMEVVDAVELSLQKGRTIEVVQQQLTERLAFRGTMAALGCGLLLVAFLAIVVVAILGGAEGLVREKIAPSWPLLLLAVLAFFLLMQAVPFLAQKPSQRDGERKPRN